MSWCCFFIILVRKHLGKKAFYTCFLRSDIFSLGFGPFRWVCTSSDPKDLAETDNIATSVLQEISARVTDRIRQQYDDNIRWIREAGKHKMVCFERRGKCNRNSDTSQRSLEA